MTIQLTHGQYGYVGRSGMAYVPGICRDFYVQGTWSPAPPIKFDHTIVDMRARQEWAAVRIQDLSECTRPVAAREWTRAAGLTPVLLLAERVGPQRSAPLLRAFGLHDTGCMGRAMDWALTAHPRDYAGAQDSVRSIGVMYVLAALEVLDFRSLYTFVVAMYKVPHQNGMALR